MNDRQLARREFLETVARAAGLAIAEPLAARPAQVTLRISSLSHEVAAGRVYRTTAYNGVVPAPLVRLAEGVPVAIHITNATDTAEYIHWHGLHVPAEADGTCEEGSLVAPPRGEVRYQIIPEPAGARFVHSHAMTGMNLEGGTYSGQFGFVYVQPKQDKGRYDQEIFLTTHEWGPEMVWRPADDDDQPEAGASPASGNWEIQYDIGSINGKALGHGEPIRVRPGQRVLMHFLNASATAVVGLALPRHRFLIVALDGNRVPSPQLMETIELGPGERADAIVEMGHPGIWVLGAVDDDDREAGGMGVVVEYAGMKGPSRWIPPPPARRWDYSIFGRPVSAENRHAETIPMVIDRIAPVAGGMESWTINGKSYDAKAPVRLAAKTTYRLVFTNRSDDHHPLHLHRYSFEIKNANGRKTAGVIKDVAMLRARGTLEVEFTPRQPGPCLFHCHQQMHMDNGFKTLFVVE